MIDATAAFAPVPLTRIVADDTVNMVEWWAQRDCPTEIDGDELARMRDERGLRCGYTQAWMICNRDEIDEFDQTATNYFELMS